MVKEQEGGECRRKGVERWFYNKMKKRTLRSAASMPLKVEDFGKLSHLTQLFRKKRRKRRKNQKEEERLQRLREEGRNKFGARPNNLRGIERI